MCVSCVLCVVCRAVRAVSCVCVCVLCGVCVMYRATERRPTILFGSHYFSADAGYRRGFANRVQHHLSKGSKRSDVRGSCQILGVIVYPNRPG